MIGPVTFAMRAVRTEEAPVAAEGSPTRRRALQAAVTAVLTGEIVSRGLHKGTGPDLGFVAECWLEDAYALGLLLIRQPDGQVWRSVLIFDGSERAQAREDLWTRLQARPRLYRAVHKKAAGGFLPAGARA